MTQNNQTDSADSLPSKSDFNPWGPNALDAERAWRNFGGLTLKQAHAKFRERHYTYQEDFMFMGPKAFAFYFPVIEDFLHDVPDQSDNGDDYSSWILAHCINNQFGPHKEKVPHVIHLADRVIALSHFVRNNIQRFSKDDAERAKITDAWQELCDHVELIKQSKTNL